MKTKQQNRVWVNIFFITTTDAMGGDDYVTKLFRRNF